MTVYGSAAGARNCFGQRYYLLIKSRLEPKGVSGALSAHDAHNRSYSHLPLSDLDSGLPEGLEKPRRSVSVAPRFTQDL